MVESAQEAPIYAVPARIVTRDGERAAGGLSREDLLSRALDRAVDPDFLRENPPYFWSAEISSSRMDSYSTTMQDSTLRNFAADAEAGVPFQNSHNLRTLPFGASLSGRFENGRRNADGEKPARTIADFYTVPGLKSNETSTDDLIRGQKAGILRDVSVGFHGGRQLCSICGRDQQDLSWLWGDGEGCMHFPGERYDVTDDAGKKTGEKALCVGRIEGAHLLEVSQVYKGATPNAAVLKAQRAAEAGKLPPELARRLEDRYRIALPASHRVWTGATTPKEQSMPEPNEQEQRMSGPDAAVKLASGDPGTVLTPAVRAALEKMGFAPAADNPTALEHSVRQAAEELERVRAENTRLGPLADDGRAYRNDLIEQTIEWGVRAHAEAFPQETYRELLATASVEHLKKVRAGFEEKAGTHGVNGGARTNGTVTDDRTTPPAGTPGVPLAAYRTQ